MIRDFWLQNILGISFLALYYVLVSPTDLHSAMFDSLYFRCISKSKGDVANMKVFCARQTYLPEGIMSPHHHHHHISMWKWQFCLHF
jgi:hypothetical protein